MFMVKVWGKQGWTNGKGVKELLAPSRVTFLCSLLHSKSGQSLWLVKHGRSHVDFWGLDHKGVCGFWIVVSAFLSWITLSRGDSYHVMRMSKQCWGVCWGVGTPDNSPHQLAIELSKAAVSGGVKQDLNSLPGNWTQVAWMKTRNSSHQTSKD